MRNLCGQPGSDRHAPKQDFNLVNGYGGTEQVSLHLIAMQAVQQGALRFRLDALGDYIELQ
jgi:hypothetical protein